MDPRSSIGHSVGNVLASIKTKGAEALEATTRFLRWSVTPFKILGYYIIGRSSSDDVQGASPSAKQPTATLSSRHVTVANEPINTLITKIADFPGFDEEREIVSKAVEFLNSHLPESLSRLPKVTLEDTRSVLEAYYQVILLSPESLPREHGVHKAIRKLEDHFQNTRQSDGFTELKNTVGLSSLHNIRDTLKNADFEELLDRCRSNAEQRKIWQDVMKPILDSGSSEQASIHGHPLEVMSAKDHDLIWKCKDYLGSNFHYRVKDALSGLPYYVICIHDKVRRLPNALEKLNLKKVEQDFEQYELLQNTLSKDQKCQSRDFKELEARCKTHRALIAEGRATLLDIQLNEGRRWDLKLLSKKMSLGVRDIDDYQRNDQMLKKLFELDRLRGPQVDLAQLDWIIAQNNKAKTHPNVAIEGGGPTGLTLAFTQFQEGANVSVFEKRSTEYNRVQVVRLDPKWLEMLKFYLGEHYYDMFGQDGQPGKGTIRPDGFGEIAIHRLEEGLNHRLTELMARHYEHASQSRDSRRAKIERLAAYEMRDVEDSEEGFTVKAKYNPKYDPSPFANGKTEAPTDYKKPAAVITRPVDLVICAGGKNSQLRNQYMEDQTVTDARNYAVCSWEGTKDQPIPNDKLDTFPDFRGVVVLDEEFHQSFREQMKFQLDQVKELSPEEREFFNQQMNAPASPLFQLEQSTSGKVLQTRCFDNKNLVYIGMELPEELSQFRQEIKNQLVAMPVPEFNESDVKLSKDDQQLIRHNRVVKVQKALSKAWFQTVANSYGVDQTKGVTPEKINESFAATFPVQQHRVKQNVIEKKSGSHKVVITAAGDAAASPHFMTASGLTGAREHALHLQDYTKKISHRESSNSHDAQAKRRVALRKLEEKYQATGDFVIHRGEVFLGRPSIFRRLLGLYRTAS